MKNAVYACNVENKIVQISCDIDAHSVHNTASQVYNQSVEVNPKRILAEAATETTNGNIAPIESGTFAYPNKITIKKRKTVEEFCFLNPNEQQVCYSIHTIHKQDMGSVNVEENNIYVTEIVKPKKKRQRKKKVDKQKNHVAEVAMLKWEDLCFQPDAQVKYDCNIKPNDYVQFLNNPVCDPMFCQFDTTNDKHTYNEEPIHDFE